MSVAGLGTGGTDLTESSLADSMIGFARAHQHNITSGVFILILLHIALCLSFIICRVFPHKDDLPLRWLARSIVEALHGLFSTDFPSASCLNFLMFVFVCRFAGSISPPKCFVQHSAM